jgi:UDP-N-acetylmuramyl pentapeptide synthase
LVVAVGQDARWIAEEAVVAGFPAGTVRHFADTAAAALGIRDLLKPGDTLLFKASRGMELDRVEAAASAEMVRGGAEDDAVLHAAFGTGHLA